MWSTLNLKQQEAINTYISEGVKKGMVIRMFLQVQFCNAWPEAVDTSRETHVFKNKTKQNNTTSNNKSPKTSIPQRETQKDKKSICIFLSLLTLVFDLYIPLAEHN